MIYNGAAKLVKTVFILKGISSAGFYTICGSYDSPDSEKLWSKHTFCQPFQKSSNNQVEVVIDLIKDMSFRWQWRYFNHGHLTPESDYRKLSSQPCLITEESRIVNNTVWNDFKQNVGPSCYDFQYYTTTTTTTTPATTTTTLATTTTTSATTTTTSATTTTTLATITNNNTKRSTNNVTTPDVVPSMSQASSNRPSLDRNSLSHNDSSLEVDQMTNYNIFNSTALPTRKGSPSLSLCNLYRLLHP